MFNKFPLHAAAAAVLIASAPAVADAEYGPPDNQVVRPAARSAPPPPRPEQRRPAQPACRSETGSLLGAIAAGLLGRQMPSAPRGRGGRRDCR
jgi:uncharacterized protein YcfJ